MSNAVKRQARTKTDAAFDTQNTNKEKGGVKQIYTRTLVLFDAFAGVLFVCVKCVVVVVGIKDQNRSKQKKRL